MAVTKNRNVFKDSQQEGRILLEFMLKKNFHEDVAFISLPGFS